MKIIKVVSCYECPYYKYESPDCGNDYLYCSAIGEVLAKERKIIIKKFIILPLTCTITPQAEEWKFVQEDGTIFDGNKISERCALEDV